MSAIEINIDGCQYLIYDRSLSHKGNCTNNFHLENRQFKVSRVNVEEK